MVPNERMAVLQICKYPTSQNSSWKARLGFPAGREGSMRERPGRQEQFKTNGLVRTPTTLLLVPYVQGPQQRAGRRGYNGTADRLVAVMPLLESFDDALAAPSTSSPSPQLKVVGGKLRTSPADWANLQTNLVSHSHGLVSSIYRRSLSSSASWPYDPSSSASGSTGGFSELSHAATSADGLPGWVCIKRVSPDTQPRPHSISREIALLDSLSHRNVASLLAAILDESDPFGASVDLVLPLYAVNLEEVLEEPSLVSLSESSAGEVGRAGKSISHLWSDSSPSFIQSISKQLLEGVAFLHANSIAHRDIKPSNILLSHIGVVKLIDFGTAYTTSSLKDPLSPGVDLDAGEREGRMVCQVGTGQFRAPELLFSPIGGYDAFAVDIWAVGVTLAHFFTALSIAVVVEEQADMPDLDVQDERKDWEKAFSSNAPLSPSSSSSSSNSLYWEESEPEPPSPRTASGYIRTPLFTSDKGDIGLAASIFALLGLPTDVRDWPEAEHFQPPLARLPFAPTHGTGLLSALPLFGGEQESSALVHKVILPAITLSASKRPKASELLAAL
ncbi:likely protein kinase [Pseudozyma hubeiensis SY62]|uniref:Likely protein kinase n=1 Tax=Pseudozyma hubeiensis (strain SY62) TaxID=1305764 RepID=R9PBY4_PSEHS|nr:likely protein kinase [Pseudozyma hubeiensis SY62]GAC98839.1 likely protein kinase [Pseudozyma hubeiensis SY62]